MGYEDVNVTGKSSLSPQEVDNRRKEFAKLREEGHTIELTARGKNSGVSYDYMDRLNKDIEAGIFEDRTEEGFTNKDKLGLANEFESVFLDHGYIKSKDDFLRMKASNKKGGRSYEITYDEYIKLANAAGYYLVEKPEEPAKPKEAKAPDNKPEPVAEDKKAVPTPEVPTPKPVEEPKNEKLDTVILDSTTYTDENGNVIADDTRALVNGQPYHSKTGFNTFGTLDPEHVDWRQYSQSELDKMENAPTGKKTTTEPDTLPKPAPNDKALTPTEEINLAEPVVVADATPEVKPTPTVDATPVAKPTPTVDATPEVKPTPTVDATPEVKPTPTVDATPVVKPTPTVDATPVAKPTPTVDATPVAKPTPTVDATPVAKPTPTVNATPEVKPTPTVDATPVKNTKTESAKEEFQKALASDPELGNKTDKECAEILKAKASSIETEISRLQQPTVVYKKRLFGGSKSKVIATAEQNTEANKDKIAELEQKLDSTKRIKEYTDAVAGNITGFGSTSLVDKNGNTVASYPQYSTVKYKNANGQESYVARVMEYNTTTHKSETKYYSFDVQKVNDLKGLPERWQAVPDMKNQLTDGQEVR